MYKEFKPTILFLVKFIGFYLLTNFLYGLYVESYAPLADPVTHWVTNQTSSFLNVLGQNTGTSAEEGGKNVLIMSGEQEILAVYEGCNGINVFIVFMAFVVSFGNPGKKALWFVPLGILIIHLSNLARIVLLYFVHEHLPGLMYFTHKYLFTSVIYLMVFILWYVWITKIRKTFESPETPA